MTRRKRLARAFFAVAVLATGGAVLVPGATTTAQAADATGTGTTRSVTATRTFVDADGKETEVDRRQVSMTVSQTQDLRGRQEVHVSWEGAVPTGGTVGDPTSSDGRNQEHPFVLLECRGVDAATGQVPSGQDQLSPETCWTQTSPERYVAAATSTPAWRFDASATSADRQAVVGAPDPLPAACANVSQATSARWLPLRAANGKTYYGGPDPGVGCAPLAPESDSAEAGGLPSNTTYGVTGKDGRGQTDFAVWTAAENATLGCTADVSCSLVAVPVLGISCDAWGRRLPSGTVQTTRTGTPLTPDQLASADATCRRTGAYEPGEPRSSTTSDQAVRGNLWWSPSNWANRITVPLSFARTGNVCDVVSKTTPQEILGSVVANELTASWRPTFCTDPSLFTFTHVQQADTLARTLVNAGEVDAAFATAPRPGGYSRPVVQAPTAVGGFALAFSIDDASQARRTTLELDARLVAKLLSSSYPGVAVMRDNHPGLADNPLNITLDPEFEALNPGLPQSSNLEAAAALQITSASSDLIWALTSWLDSDPEARAFLDGKPDPWGMTVNPSYKSVELPTDSWPLLDDYIAPRYYQDQNACYAKSPTPFMNLIANPQSSLGAVVLNMQFASSAVQTVCRYDGYDPTTQALRTQGRQTVGYRFVMGLVSLSAAQRYNLRTASLQTTSSVPAGTRFTDASDRTFVAPDAAGLSAASRLLDPQVDDGSWTLDYSALSTTRGEAAYPGAMPIYTVVPTQGLDETTATNLAKFLCYADGPGQDSGLTNGQLPPGYLAVSDANGLGAQEAYLRSAVVAVRAQQGDVPALDATPPDRARACDFSARAVLPSAAAATPTTKPVKATPTATPTTAAPAAAAPPAGGGSGLAGPPAAATVPVAAAPAAAPASQEVVTDARTTLTSGQTSMFGRLGGPGLILLAFATALAGSLLQWSDKLVPLLAGAGAGARRRVAARRVPPASGPGAAS